MTVERITPCVCCDHLPNEADAHDYGMPVLIPCNGLKPFQQFWEAKCPQCGRGGLVQYKSAYLALRGWNELMAECYATQESPFSEEPDELSAQECSDNAQTADEPNLTSDEPTGQKRKSILLTELDLGREAVDLAISDNYKNWSLDTNQAVEDALRHTNKQVIKIVLSVAINKSPADDPRFTKQNREWAKQVRVENSLIMDVFRSCFYMSAHPGLINLFTDAFRERTEAQENH